MALTQDQVWFRRWWRSARERRAWSGVRLWVDAYRDYRASRIKWARSHPKAAKLVKRPELGAAAGLLSGITAGKSAHKAAMMQRAEYEKAAAEQHQLAKKASEVDRYMRYHGYEYDLAAMQYRKPGKAVLPVHAQQMYQTGRLP